MHTAKGSSQVLVISTAPVDTTIWSRTASVPWDYWLTGTARRQYGRDSTLHLAWPEKDNRARRLCMGPLVFCRANRTDDFDQLLSPADFEFCFHQVLFAFLFYCLRWVEFRTPDVA